ncbi:Putative peptidoglycan binding domain-containing protein [Tranquillimonas rosea]|uniref:Putative peptidoglycan binding domain-containing protein n=1 Tax=Tranquillimonas rosea TaxID=641238 RepID=A0A1H9WFG0_9RHOB|nr:peptidoglycan-binding domain-containing protein [Tranquillimonas rosea]SES32658.1 Putative peptidoglycan binding domain-containing protein [Tranquillimonas rosea]
MKAKSLLFCGVAAALVLGPAPRADADAGDFVAGAIVGAIVNHAAKQQPQRTYRAAPTRTRSSTKTYRPRLPATQEGRQLQTSLNYFGFNAGSVDGQLGKQSRAAISRYQAYMGYPATGQLTPFEQSLLVDSYNRAQAGGPATAQRIAITADGTRGLLKAYRAEMAGVPLAPQQQMTTAVVAPAIPAAPMTAATGAVTTTTTTMIAGAGEAATPEAEIEEAEAPAGLPNLFGGATMQASLASHCNTVSLLTNTNGGFTTVSTLTDPNVALNEQFCLARTYAIATGEEMAKGLQAAPAQISEHCTAYGNEMAPHVAALSVQERDDVVRGVSAFVLSTGVPTNDLAATAKVCLSEGYRTDDMDVALGAALILVTLGEKGYGELVGHHLSQGFGSSRRMDLAMDWYEDGLSAADGGTAVFAPGQPDRVELIRAATRQLGAPDEAALPEMTPQNAALPTFSAAQ